MSIFVHGHGPGSNQLPANLGQTVSASSLSVVIASDYTLPVTIATAANNPMWVELTDGTAGYTGVKTGQLPAALGQTTMAGSLAVTLASNQSALSVAQSGTWSARLQDGSGNLLNSTSNALNVNAAQLPSTIGAHLSAASLSVVIASDSSVAATQSGAWTVTQSGTWTVQPGNTANSTPWLVTDSSDGPVTAGAVASKSSLVGVQFNTSLPTLTTGQQAALQADSSGRILVSALPTGANVIGAVTQSGTWSVTGLPTGLGQKTMANSMSVVVSSDQSAVPVSGTFWQATQPVSAASLPLPTGAATAAKQPALGTAGTASTDVITVQGIASMTALKVDGSAVTQPVSGTVSAKLFDSGGAGVTLGQQAASLSLPAVLSSRHESVTTPVAVQLSTGSAAVDFNTGLAGTSTQRVSEAGRAKAWVARNDYTSTSVTTGAYVQLIASTAASTTRLRIFDSSGSAMILATGGAGSEVDQLYIPPGGWDGPIEFNIASATRISLKALDAAASVGQIVITALS